MKNKVLKSIIATMLIIAIAMADFMLLGINLVTYASKSIDDSTSNDNIKFAAYFKSNDNETPQIEYEMNKSDMKLYIKVGVENEGYFDGVITLENSNFKLKQEITNSLISSIEGNTITLNRVRAGNIAEIELGIEPVKDESYNPNNLSKQSMISLTGQYVDSTENKTVIESAKNVTLSLVAPKNLETELEAKTITNRTYKIGEANKKLVQVELKSKVLKNAYPVKTTTFELELPAGAEKVEVISKGTYATDGKAEKVLAENIILNQSTLKIVLENKVTDGKISWKQDVADNILVTLTFPETAEIFGEFSAKTKIELYGQQAKTLENEVKYSVTEEADGIIRTSIENSETIYKGKIYSKEDRDYASTTNIEVNYANLVEANTLTEKVIYRTENKEKASNVQYKTTTISKAEFNKVLGSVGKITIKDQNANIVKEITLAEFGENENITITYAEGVKGLTIELTKAVTTGIIRLNHIKSIKAESYTKQEISELKELVEQATVKYSTAEYSFERIKTLNETKSEISLTVTPQVITAEETKEVQMAITLKTDNEKYELFANPTFTLTMPEGVTINSVSNGTISASNGELAISKLEGNQRKITLQLSGAQQKYVTSEINTQISFTANVSVEKLMANRKDTIKVEYTNQGKSYETQSAMINAVSSNAKIFTHLQVENYNGLGTILQKYSDSTIQINGKLPIDNTETIQVPVKYTIVNNFNAAIALEPTIVATKTDKEGNTQELMNYSQGEIIMEAGKLQVIEQTLQIPAGLYYSENIELNAQVKYNYSGTEYEVTNIMNFATEEKEGVRSNTIIDNKLQVGTFAQLGDGTGIQSTDEVYNEQIITYIVEVTNISNSTVSNIKVTNSQENGNIYDLKEVIVNDRVNEFIEHTYAELDTNTKTFEIETLRPGESKEIICRVVAKRVGPANTTTANMSIMADNINEQKLEKISNAVVDSDLKITTKNAHKEEVIIYGNNIYNMLTNIKNLTNRRMENVNIRIYMTDGLTYPEGYTLQALNMEENIIDILSKPNYNKEEGYVEFEISKLDANQEIMIMSYLHINSLPLEQIGSKETIYVTANNLCSNNVEINVVQNETLITVSQRVNIKEDQKVKNNEKVIITAEISNKGYINTQIEIQDELPVGLEVVKVELIRKNGTIDTTESLGVSKDFISIVTDIEKGEIIKIKIEAIVNTSLIVTEEIKNTIVAIPEMGMGGTSNEVIIKIDSDVDTGTGNEDGEIDGEKPEEGEPEHKNPDEENPNYEKPNEDNPGGETPGGDEPGGDEPGGDNPGGDEPGGDEPGGDNPGGDEPGDDPEPTYTISGNAWIDKNSNNSKDDGESIKNIIVKILDVNNNNTFLKDANGKEIEVKTNANGDYKIAGIKEGKYNLIFKYDTNTYELVTSTEIKDYIIEGTNEKVAITGNIEVKEDKQINLQLKELTKFDLRIDKYISKVITQTSNETKTVGYVNKQLVREEIARKYMSGATVLVEYTLQIRNIGELAGYATEIIDYLPQDMKFYSELNTEWYMGEDGNLYNTSLAVEEIKPEETKIVKLILSKTMNNENTGVTANIAEISETMNIKEYADIDSSNDSSKAEIIINPATGTIVTYTVAILNAVVIVAVGMYIIKKKVIGKEQ